MKKKPDMKLIKTKSMKQHILDFKEVLEKKIKEEEPSDENIIMMTRLNDLLIWQEKKEKRLKK